MTKLLPALIMLLGLTIVSCNKEKDQKATVIRDCTGTYLRIDSKYYQVCNTEILESFTPEDRVIATYKIIKECNDPDYEPPICDKLLEFEEWIEVKEIRPE